MIGNHKGSRAQFSCLSLLFSLGISILLPQYFSCHGGKAVFQPPSEKKQVSQPAFLYTGSCFRVDQWWRQSYVWTQPTGWLFSWWMCIWNMTLIQSPSNTGRFPASQLRAGCTQVNPNYQDSIFPKFSAVFQQKWMRGDFCFLSVYRGSIHLQCYG